MVFAHVRNANAVVCIGPQRFAVLPQNMGRADPDLIQAPQNDGLLEARQLYWPLQSLQLFIGLARHMDVSSTAAELIVPAGLRPVGKTSADSGYVLFRAAFACRAELGSARLALAG